MIHNRSLIEVVRIILAAVSGNVDEPSTEEVCEL
jgi:hypothetical protein